MFLKIPIICDNSPSHADTGSSGTHNVSFLPQIDKIIVLKDGTVSEVSFVQHPFFVPTVLVSR